MDGELCGFLPLHWGSAVGRPKLLLSRSRAGRFGPCGLAWMDQSVSPGNSQFWQSRLLPVLVQSWCGPRAVSRGSRVDHSQSASSGLSPSPRWALVVSSSPPLLAHRILPKTRRNVHGLARPSKHPRGYLKRRELSEAPAQPFPLDSVIVGSSGRRCDYGRFLIAGALARFRHPPALASRVVYRRVKCTGASSIARRVEMACSHAMPCPLLRVKPARTGASA